MSTFLTLEQDWLSLPLLHCAADPHGLCHPFKPQNIVLPNRGKNNYFCSIPLAEGSHTGKLGCPSPCSFGFQEDLAVSHPFCPIVGWVFMFPILVSGSSMGWHNLGTSLHRPNCPCSWEPQTTGWLPDPLLRGAQSATLREDREVSPVYASWKALPFGRSEAIIRDQ